MNAETLAFLGITKAEAVDMLVSRMVERYFNTEDDYRNEFEETLKKSVKEQADTTLKATLEKHVLPNINQMTESLCLEETNKWGQKTGKKLTFIEYLTERADAYIREEVDISGKSKQESGSYSWQGRTTRIAYLIHQHLQYSIETAMKQALGAVNSSVRKGLEEATKIALANIKVEVKTEVKS